MTSAGPSDRSNAEVAKEPDYYYKPRELTEPPKNFEDWLLAFLITPICGVVVLAIWDYDVWKRFARIVWSILGVVIAVFVLRFILVWASSQGWG